MPTLAPGFFLLMTLPALSEFTAEESAGVLPQGVGFADVADSTSSSSSTPKESFPFPTSFRFFLKEGFGVEALYLAN
jgi:hypothetical protein